MPYLEQPKLKKIDHPTWKYVLEEDWEVFIYRLRKIKYYSFSTKYNGECRQWFKIKDGILIIKKGYATDGCTSSPDFENNLCACITHDALAQSATWDKKCPWNYEEANKVFFDIMKWNGFGFWGRWAYYLGVSSIFGRAYRSILKKFDLDDEGRNVCYKEDDE